MLIMNRDAITIIDLLGGTCAVAALCGITAQAVSQWKNNGIPKPWDKYLREVRPDVFMGRADSKKAA